MSERKQLAAFVLPMVLFIALLALVSALHAIGHTVWLDRCEYWIYPLQTILCGALMIWFWREYQLQRPAGILFGIVVGILVFVLWISPQQFFGFAPRTDGFNPDTFATQPSLYWSTVFFRFIRLVIVVPLVEEIFWRGFLLRYLIDEKFEQVAIGTFSWLSFSVVTVAFVLIHSQPDWPAALICGVLYNLVAYRTKSLTTCVVTHALTNLLLGLWIIHSKQWGFW